MNRKLNGESDATQTTVVPSPDTSGGSIDPGLAAVLEEYLALVKVGRRPTREEFLSQHPAQSAALAECLEGLEFILSAAPQIVKTDEGQSGISDVMKLFDPTTRLGDFRIIREVGRGGMGVVYEAQQVSLGRRVALKVLPLGASLDPRQRQRFQLEAQAAAHLQHPHIVPVYAVGSDQGVHYYSMQFIEGRSLAEVAKQMRMEAEELQSRASGDGLACGEAELPGSTTVDASPLAAAANGQETSAGQPSSSEHSGLTPGPGSSTRNREFCRTIARLGIQAADALEHAHALGVIHRDIKPANLLIDGTGELWVTDFGLARFLDDSGMTRTGDLLGTLAYMSPEQALGRRDVDHRSDIYSLGATLYELLTLQPAFEGRGRQELLHKIAHDEPVRLRKLNPSVPRDLETVVLKAMEKEPAARYATAKDLSDDLRRFLDDQPIQARRPNFVEKLAKWTRRHRPAVVTAAVLLLLALAVSTGLMWQQERQTEEARQSLRDNLRDTFEIADEVSMKAMERYTRDAMDPLSLINSDELHNFYRRVLQYYERVARQPESDTQMQSIVARANQRIGFTRMCLGERGDAAYRLAVSQYEALIAREPAERKHRAHLAYALSDWGRMTMLGNGIDAAEPLYRRSLEIRQDMARTLDPDPAEICELATTQVELASLLAGAGRASESEQRHQELRSLFEEIAGKLPATTAARHQFAVPILSVGVQYMSGGNRLDAERFLRLADTLNPGDSVVCNDMAWLLASRPDLAPYDPKKAVALARTAVDQAPQNADFWNTLAVAQYRNGDDEAAADALERSMKLKSGGTPIDWLFLAMTRWRQGDKSAARSWFNKARDWLEKHPTQDRDLPRFEHEAAVMLGLAAPDERDVRKAAASKPSSATVTRDEPASARKPGKTVVNKPAPRPGPIPTRAVPLNPRD
jgi:serine/threonine protein kinase